MVIYLILITESVQNPLRLRYSKLKTRRWNRFKIHRPIKRFYCINPRRISFIPNRLYVTKWKIVYFKIITYIIIVDGLPFPDTGCPVPDVSIYYMSNINELPDGILFHWFCKCTPPWMFLPLDIPSEYRPEHVTFGLLCVIFKFPSRIFCRRVPGFATDCPCGVWCRGLTTCLLYVGPPLEFLVWNDSGYVNLTKWWYFFIIFEYILHISTPHIMIFCFPLPYFPLSTSALFFA